MSSAGRSSIWAMAKVGSGLQKERRRGSETTGGVSHELELLHESAPLPRRKGTQQAYARKPAEESNSRRGSGWFRRSTRSEWALEVGARAGEIGGGRGGARGETERKSSGRGWRKVEEGERGGRAKPAPGGS